LDQDPRLAWEVHQAPALIQDQGLKPDLEPALWLGNVVVGYCASKFLNITSKAFSTTHHTGKARRFVKINTAEALQLGWEQANVHCKHPQVVHERDEKDEDTGKRLGTACGE
jgi:hypothetical protein